MSSEANAADPAPGAPSKKRRRADLSRSTSPIERMNNPSRKASKRNHSISGWKDLFKECDQDPLHPILRIYEDTPSDIWSSILEENVSLVVVRKPIAPKRTRRKIIDIVSRCCECSLPVFRNKGDRFLESDNDQPQNRIVALCFVSVKPEMRGDLEFLVRKALVSMFPVVFNSIKGSWKAVNSLWRTVLCREGTVDFDKQVSLPVVVGEERVLNLLRAGKARLVVMSKKAFMDAPVRWEGPLFSILEFCYKNKVPCQFLPGDTPLDVTNLGSYLTTKGCTVACITDGDSSYAKAMEPILLLLKNLSAQTHSNQLRETNSNDSTGTETASAGVSPAVAGSLARSKSDDASKDELSDVVDAEEEYCTNQENQLLSEESAAAEQKAESRANCDQLGPEGGGDYVARDGNVGCGSVASNNGEENDSLPLEGFAGLSEEDLSLAEPSDILQNTEADAPDVKVIRLEEEIAILESSLRTITKRKHKVTREHDVALRSIHNKEKRLSVLVDEQNQLRETLERQKRLQKDLELLLERSQHQLRRLVSPDENLSLDEITELANRVDMDEDDSVSEEGSFPCSETANESKSDSEKEAEVTAERLQAFWVSKKSMSDRVGSFIPFLRSREHVLSILKTSVEQVLAVDADDNGWQYRRQSQWNSCLDVRLMILSAECEGEKTVQRKTGYRTDGIDPAIQLCPYELAGECLDDNCAYQHLQHRRYGSLIPRELLPLPNLCLAVNESAEQDRDDDSSSSLGTAESLSGDKAGENNTAENFASNEDFISLPSLHLKKGGYQETQLLFRGGIDDLLTAKKAAYKSGSFLWLAESSLRELPDRRLSADLLLQRDGALLFASSDVPKDNSEGFAVLARLISYICFASHAGRYDVTSKLFLLADNLCEGWKTHGNAGNMSSSIVELMREMENQSFAYDSTEGSHIFHQCFEIQIVGAVLVCILDDLSSSQVDMEPERCQDAWSKFLLALHGSVVRNGKRPDSAGKVLDFLKYDAFVWKKETTLDEELNSQSLSKMLHLFLDDFKTARETRGHMSGLLSLPFLIDQVLPRSLQLFQDLVKSGLEAERKPTRVVFKRVSILSEVIFGSIENAASRICVDENVEQHKSDCLALFVTIDRILKAVQKEAPLFPPLELILSPLFAANCALASTIKLYDRAHQKLQSLLSFDYVGSPSPSLCNLSELLWSQLIQLYSSLPKRSEVSPGVPQRRRILSSEIRDVHDLISSEVGARGVFPHHVSLSNDWHLVDYLSQQNDDAFCRTCQDLSMQMWDRSSQAAEIDFRLAEKRLSYRSTRGEACQIGTTVPYSLLLAGRSLSSLCLVRVSLKTLPAYFGSYFPSLKVSHDWELAGACFVGGF